MRLLLANQMKKMKVMSTKRQMKKITRALAYLTIEDKINSSRVMIKRSVLSEGYDQMTATTSKKSASGMKRTLTKRKTPRRAKERTMTISAVVQVESLTRRHKRLCIKE